MLGIKILSTEPISFRDILADFGMKVLYPIPRRVWVGVNRTGMKIVGVEGGIFSVHLDCNYHILSFEMIHGFESPVVIGHSRRPRQMVRPRIFKIFMEEPQDTALA
jgi:hypothetical protein